MKIQPKIRQKIKMGSYFEKSSKSSADFSIRCILCIYAPGKIFFLLSTGKLTVGHWTAPRPHRASPLSSYPAHAAPPAQPATTTHPADPMQVGPPSPAISHSHMNIFLQDCCDKKATLGDFPQPPAPPAYARFFISFHFKSSPVMQISLHPKSMKIQTHKSVILIC